MQLYSVYKKRKDKTGTKLLNQMGDKFISPRSKHKRGQWSEEKAKELKEKFEKQDNTHYYLIG